MTEDQKENRGYIVFGLLLFAYWADQFNHYIHNGYEYSIQMEQKTGQHWIQDLHGQPLGDY